jgi:hypothetical protein
MHDNSFIIFCIQLLKQGNNRITSAAILASNGLVLSFALKRQLNYFWPWFWSGKEVVFHFKTSASRLFAISKTALGSGFANSFFSYASSQCYKDHQIIPIQILLLRFFSLHHQLNLLTLYLLLLKQLSVPRLYLIPYPCRILH